MKNFTKQNFKTNPLWIRLLIIAFMLLAGTSSAWAAYYVTGDAFGSWGTWYELKYETANRYTRSISNINGEFKLSSGQTYDNCWNSLGCGNGVKCGGGSNHKMLGVTGILCFDPSGNNGNGYIWVEEVIQEPSAYSLGGYINQSDVKSYSDTYKLTKQSDGTYKRTISFTKVHNNAQYLWIIDDLGNKWGVSSDTDLTTGNSITLTKGVESGKVKAIGVIDTDYVFIFNPSNGELSYLASCSTPNFSVSLSKSEVAVGCTDVTASITGNDSRNVTVTWSSSDTKVATIDSDGAITIKAAGTTTIIATTTEAGGFCGGVEKPATLTVKSPSVEVSANKNSLCEDETLTLTATLTNCGEGNSIQWYKGDDLIADETSATLTISSVTTANSGNYKAVVSGGILCSSVASTPITITVNALPSAPILTTGSTNVCPGTLTLANFKAMAEQNTVVWYSNEECTQVVTTPTVEKGGTYTFYAKSKNASGCFSEGFSTLEVKVYDEPADFTLTAIPAEICSGADVVISISNKQDGVTYKLGNETIAESIKVNPTEDTEYYTVTAYLNACPDLTKSISTDIKVNPIPSFTVAPTNLSLCKGSTSVTDLTELSHVVVENGDPVWYDLETAGNVVTTGADLENGGTYWVAAENAEKGCVNPQRKSFTLKIHDLPKYPDLKKRSAAVCQEANATVSLNELAEITDVIWYQGENEVQGPDAISIAEAGTFTYTAKAVNINGCQSATGVDFTLTVNPLPTITSISASNDKPVPFEDVVLTAEDTDAKTINWLITSGDGELSENTGTSVVLTSSTAGTVTVTATATSAAGCTSTVATKTVTFGAEDCNSTTTTEQQTVGKTKIIVNNPHNWTTMKCYAWRTTDEKKILGNWSGTAMTKNGNNYEILIDFAQKGISESDKIKVIFNNESSQTVDSKEVSCNKIYQFSISTSKDGDKYKIESQTASTDPYTEPVEVTVDPEITTPAVKVTSLSTTPGEGDINFSGQIVKTGCDNSITYGFEYKKVGAANWTQVVLGTDLDKDPGFTFSDNTVKELDGTYEVRAFITNDHSTQYSDVKTIELSTSTVPVGLAKIELTALDGTPVEKFCIGSTAYIKVTSDVKYTTATWKSDLGVEIVPTRTTNIYQFIVKGNDEIVVLLSNRYNVEPVSSEPLEVEVYASPSVPEIALGASSICDTNLDGTTLTVTRTKAGQYYALYKEDGNGGTLVEDYQLCLTDNAQIEFTGLKEAAKYFVKTYRGECDSEITRSSSATLTVVDSKDVNISIEPTATETTPWMPVKLTVTATSDYTVTSDPNGAVINISGNIVKVKLPLPTEGVQNKGTTENDVNVTFTDVPYTITAELKTAGEEGNPCAQPAIANITLKPYIEICD